MIVTASGAVASATMRRNGVPVAITDPSAVNGAISRSGTASAAPASTTASAPPPSRP